MSIFFCVFQFHRVILRFIMHKYKQNKKQTIVNFFLCRLIVELYPVQEKE